MSGFSRVSLYISNDEKRILDATASRLGISRSEVIRHLALYHGLCGGDFPLTARILALPVKDRERVIQEIRERAESGDPAKPQSFRQWVKETVGNDDSESIEKGAESLLRKLLNGA
ncbi:CopG family transcriptional regulator [Luteolibacter sp. LG18]|uniref:ribbon-helix-helix domain-containing protein n=1 Tax=Luteolibacter sp. LG18 TaxID=2819286 RepID=UPI002B2D16D4|nr:hypothetical protein llg_30550 [Luteolibacter sp. LG18]